MKLKYYLRGLGIGIIVTAVLLHVSNKNVVDKQMVPEKNPIEQTVEQSQEEETELLALIEEQPQDIIENQEQANLELEDLSEEVLTNENAEKESEDAHVGADATDINIENLDAVGTETIEQSVPEEQEQSIEENPNVTELDMIEITIARGDDSGTVSRKLYNMGLVDSATQFDSYLMQHGYDKKISVGVVKIPSGSTWMEIAEKLAGH